MEGQEYIEQILQNRAARDLRMKTNPNSWLALVGLFPLSEGVNTFGTDKGNHIVLAGLPGKTCGSIVIKKGEVLLDPDPAAGFTIDGRNPEQRPLRTDHDPEPDLIQAGSLAMRILLRGERFFLRVWDSESPRLQEFRSLNYYPVNPEYRIPARFIRYDPPRCIEVFDVIGGQHGTPLVGEARFSVQGIECSLVAEGDEGDILFSFVDETRRDTTYPGGRFLSMARPEGDEIILDFNQAINWPCAYTEYATCPIPPAENHLGVRIEAGEKRYKS